MLEWIKSHDTALWWLGALSAATFVGTLVAVPILVVRIPTDYFLPRRRRPRRRDSRHPRPYLAATIAKNLVGFVLVLAGVAMLVLPGQGVITILIGIMLMNFPGKVRLEKWIVRRRAVLRAINWMRSKADHPALRLGEQPPKKVASRSDQTTERTT